MKAHQGTNDPEAGAAVVELGETVGAAVLPQPANPSAVSELTVSVSAILVCGERLGWAERATDCAAATPNRSPTLPCL